MDALHRRFRIEQRRCADVIQLWMGSGICSDMVMLGNRLYVLDMNQQSIHVFDVAEVRYVKTIPVGARHGISVGGGLAALAGPNRLFVADAFGTGQIYELEPNSEVITSVLPASDARPIALGGIGFDTLFLEDWESTFIRTIDRAGNAFGGITPATRAGSLTSDASIDPFADFDLDGDVDL